MNLEHPTGATPETDVRIADKLAVHIQDMLTDYGQQLTTPNYRCMQGLINEAVGKLERERDVARANYALAHNNLGNEVFENGKLLSELSHLRTQLADWKRVAGELATHSKAIREIIFAVPELDTTYLKDDEIKSLADHSKALTDYNQLKEQSK